MISMTPAANVVRANFARKTPEPDFAFVAGALVGPDGTISTNGLTADTGSIQAGATPLNAPVNRFTTVGTAGDSAGLPAAAPGRQLTVINATSTSMDVFPASGDIINALSANAAFALAGGTTVTFWSAVNGYWNTLASPAATFSPNVTGTLTLSDSTTPALVLATGSTNTGTITINGKTSGGLLLTTTDASGFTLTVKNAAIATSNRTLTLPDPGGADSVVYLALAQTLLAKTLTSPVVNTPTVKDLTEVVTATNVITAAETGSVFYLNSATEFVSTLPAPAAGLKFSFVVTAAPSGASYTVVTNASANIIKGAVFSADGAAGDTGTSDDTISFVDGASVAGDRVDVWSDGTSWFAYGFSRVATGITYTTAS